MRRAEDYQLLSVVLVWGGGVKEEEEESADEKVKERDGRSQCQCLCCDSWLFKGPSETCTGYSAGAVSMQSDALSVCVCLTPSITHTQSYTHTYTHVSGSQLLLQA